MIPRFLRKSVGRILNPSLERYVEDRAILKPVRETEPDDIYIVGYPKSGHTWFQNLAAGLAFGIDMESANDTLVQTLVPDIDRWKYYSRCRNPMFFKTHATPEPELRRIVYLIRDGRDVLVSYFRMLEASSPGRYSMEALIENPPDRMPWQEHVNAWQSNPHGAEICFIRYEDLLEEPEDQIRRFADFASLEASPERIAAVIEGCRFDRLREREEKWGMANKGWARNEGARFFRRGQARAFEDELSPELIDRFNERHGDLLEELGYAC